MAFKQPPKLPDFSQLIVSLDNSKIQKDNYALWQTIFLLIQAVTQMQNVLGDEAQVGVDVSKADLVTHANEALLLPNSREMVAGESVTFNKNPANKIIINAGRPWGMEPGDSDESGGGGSGPPGPIGPAGSTGATGSQGNAGPPGMDGQDPEILEPIVFPGPKGDTGSAGATGAQGPTGALVVLFDGVDGEDSYIPGPAGLAGAAGSAGATGATGLMGPPGLDGEDGIDSWIPGPTGPQGPAGSGGGGSATTVEVDLGSTATWRGKFTITDASIGASSKVLCWQAPGPYTGKGTLADEAELAPVQVIAVEPAAGSAIVKWATPPLYIQVPFGLSGGNGGKMDNAQYTPLVGAGIGFGTRLSTYDAVYNRRGNLVRGNVKFSYTIYA